MWDCHYFLTEWHLQGLMYNVVLSHELRPQDKNISYIVAVRKHCSSVLINCITAMPKIHSRTDLFRHMEMERKRSSDRTPKSVGRETLKTCINYYVAHRNLSFLCITWPNFSYLGDSISNSPSIATFMQRQSIASEHWTWRTEALMTWNKMQFSTG